MPIIYAPRGYIVKKKLSFSTCFYFYLQIFSSFFMLLEITPASSNCIEFQVDFCHLFFSKTGVRLQLNELSVVLPSGPNQLKYSQNPFVIFRAFQRINAFTVSQFLIILHFLHSFCFIFFANPEDSCDGTIHRILILL